MDRLEQVGVIMLIVIALAAFGVISLVIGLVSEVMPDHRCVDGFVQYNNDTYWEISDTECVVVEKGDEQRTA